MHRKTPAPKQFSFWFCAIFKDFFFTEHLRVTVFVNKTPYWTWSKFNYVITNYSAEVNDFYCIWTYLIQNLLSLVIVWMHATNMLILKDLFSSKQSFVRHILYIGLLLQLQSQLKANDSIWKASVRIRPNSLWWEYCWLNMTLSF